MFYTAKSKKSTEYNITIFKSIELYKIFIVIIKNVIYVLLI